jgi:chromodomain-helicase-DNA-binding protein 1
MPLPNEEQVMLQVISRPIRDRLKRVQGVTKQNIRPSKERAFVLKWEIIIIGDFINSLEADEDMAALRPRLW